jgi:CBS domain-containing protein
MGANITLMLRYLKKAHPPITPIQASLFLLGLYEDTGNLTFPSTKAEDALAAAYLLESGADLHIISTFLRPAYGRKQKDVLFRMLRQSERIIIDGYSVSINRLKVRGYTSNLALVVQMYRQILNVDAAFGIFAMDGNRCLVIGRSKAEGIDIAAIMRNMGGGGHPAAGSAMLKAADPAAVERWIREMIGDRHQSSVQIRDLMSSPVWTLSSEMAMGQAGQLLRGRGYKGAPVVDNDRLVGILSRRDFRKIKEKSYLKGPVKAFMTRNVVTIGPEESPGHGAGLMIRHNIGRLPVMENEKMIGIFSRSDAVADFYGLCPLGTCLSRGCRKKAF